MGRPSNRTARRREILGAFARVLANQGYAGATIAAVAGEAGVAPGLLHHHFTGKSEMLEALLGDLIARFRTRVDDYGKEEDALLAYVDGALKLDDRADVVAARCWVGLFAEAVRNPTLFSIVRRLIDTEIVAIRNRAKGRLTDHDAGAILAFVVGSLVVGAFAPRRVSGFAAPSLKTLIVALSQERTGAAWKA